MAGKVKPIPEGYDAVTPYLIVKGAAAAIDFYKKAFGATERMRMPGPDGKIGHAEIQVGGANVMLADESSEMGTRSPQSVGGSPVGLVLYVENVDKTVEKATAAGAKVKTKVEDKFYGDRMGTIEDPFGHVWYVGTHIEDVSPEEMKRRMEALAHA
jgi:PhnB protein